MYSTLYSLPLMSSVIIPLWIRNDCLYLRNYGSVPENKSLENCEKPLFLLRLWCLFTYIRSIPSFLKLSPSTPCLACLDCLLILFLTLSPTLSLLLCCLFFHWCLSLHICFCPQMKTGYLILITRLYMWYRCNYLL